MFLNRSFALNAKNQNFFIVAKMCGPHVEAWYFSTMNHEKIIDHGAQEMNVDNIYNNAYFHFTTTPLHSNT